MLRSVSYFGLMIEYSLILKDIKNINIRISSDGDITVSAPINMNPEKADSFVEEKAEWIFRKMAEIEQVRETTPDGDIYDGKVLFFLGEECLLRMVNSKRFQVEKGDWEITIFAKENDEKVKEKYLKWLQEQAKDVFEDSLTRMLELAEKYNLKRPELYIRNMATKWGSCNITKKRIGLNVQLMKADKACIDQVVLHEVLHLVYMGHDDAFYTALSELMPDWKERKDRLEREYNDGVK